MSSKIHLHSVTTTKHSVIFNFEKSGWSGVASFELPMPVRIPIDHEAVSEEDKTEMLRLACRHIQERLGK